MDKKEAKALFRYQVISPLLAMDIPRGKKCELYRALAEREWKEESGPTVKVSAEAIRLWLRLYKKEGFEGLKDASRCARGSHVPSELLELASGLKKEVPSRSISKTIKIMEDMEMAPPGVLRRSTLHRYLKEAGLSIRKLEVADKHDLARWQKDHANDLWQSDMLDGPWLSDPENPGRKLKTRLYVFLDDASRLVLDGRFFFKNDLPALELVFKRSLQRYGLPLRCYYDYVDLHIIVVMLRSRLCRDAAGGSRFCAILMVHGKEQLNIIRSEGLKPSNDVRVGLPCRGPRKIASFRE